MRTITRYAIQILAAAIASVGVFGIVVLVQGLVAGLDSTLPGPLATLIVFVDIFGLVLCGYSLFVAWRTITDYSESTIRHFCALLAILFFLWLGGPAEPIVDSLLPGLRSHPGWLLLEVMAACVAYRLLVSLFVTFSGINDEAENEMTASHRAC